MFYAPLLTAIIVYRVDSLLALLLVGGLATPHVDRSITLDSWALWYRGGISVVCHLLLGSGSDPCHRIGLAALVWRAAAQPLILVGIGGPFLFGIAGPMQWITILRSSKA
jgi:hypothetical protein